MPYQNTSPPFDMLLTMEEIQASLRSYIECALLWEVVEGPGGLRYQPVAPPFYTGELAAIPEHGFTDADLSAYDSRIPEVIQALITSPPTRVTNWNGEAVRRTLQLWTQELLTLPCTMFRRWDGKDSIIDQDKVWLDTRRVPARPDHVELIGTFHDFCVATTNSGAPYVHDFIITEFEFCSIWLDTHRPGWRNTVQLAESLAIGGQAFAQLLLFKDNTITPAPVPSTLVPDCPA